jgi:hypothetical protein
MMSAAIQSHRRIEPPMKSNRAKKLSEKNANASAAGISPNAHRATQ